MNTIINSPSPTRPPYRNRLQPLHTSSCSDIVLPYQFSFSKFWSKLHCPNRKIIIAFPHLYQHYRQQHFCGTLLEIPTIPNTLPTHRLIIIYRHHVTIPTRAVGICFRATTLRYDNYSHLCSDIIRSITLATPIILYTALLSTHPHHHAQFKAYLHNPHYEYGIIMISYAFLLQ